MKKKLKLGLKYRDKVTGFVGIAISKVVYMNGCEQYCLKAPIDKDGKLVDGQYFDDVQIELVKEPKKVDLKKVPKLKKTGGDMQDKPRDYYTPDGSC